MTDGEQGSRRIGVIQIDQAGSWRGMRKVLGEDDSGWSWSRSVDMLEDAVTACMVSASLRPRTTEAALIVVKDIKCLYGAACHDGPMLATCVEQCQCCSRWCWSFEEPIGVMKLNPWLEYSFSHTAATTISDCARKSQSPILMVALVPYHTQMQSTYPHGPSNPPY